MAKRGNSRKFSITLCTRVPSLLTPFLFCDVISDKALGHYPATLQSMFSTLHAASSPLMKCMENSVPRVLVYSFYTAYMPHRPSDKHAGR